MPLLKALSLALPAALTVCTLALCAAAPARAANHALILWIGDYGDPKNNLPGIDLDAANARKIAAAMGVPAQNTTEISNAQLTGENMARALVGLHQRIREGDKVFIYYSGHGGQIAGHETQARCTEGLVVRDGLVLDSEMQKVLTAIGNKASQLVMMNDSCFSGGAATRSLAPPEPDMKAKFMPPDAKTNSAVTEAYACGNATNTTRMTRSLTTLAGEARGPQVLYIAASNDTQVSFATSKGSLGTLAWAACMGAATADADRSGRINGEELRACSQAIIDRSKARQTITLQGHAQLPLSFVQAAAPVAPATVATATAAAPAPAPAPVPAPPPPAAATAALPVDASKALADLQAAADRGLQVQLSLARPSLRIGKDLLDFSVNTGQAGYLYLLQVGSDGKTFNLLFPNKLDDNNFLAAGSHRFPRPQWRLRAGGPAGTSHLLAIVSPVKKDLTRGLQQGSVFASGAATTSTTRTLVVEATGGDGADSRYGASEVLRVVETQE
jgi:Domain of unknown function (DUF4384)/Caspase domain